MYRPRPRSRRRKIAITAVASLTGLPLIFYGIPSLISDTVTWLRWFQQLSPFVPIGIALFILTPALVYSLSELWIPELASRKRLRRMAPVLQEFMDLVPWVAEGGLFTPASSDHNPTKLWLKYRVLETELHALNIRHRSLIFRPRGWHHFAEWLLCAAHAGDLDEARKAGEWWISFAANQDKTHSLMTPGKGTYECVKCGWYVTLEDDISPLPQCKQCGPGFTVYTKVGEFT